MRTSARARSPHAAIARSRRTVCPPVKVPSACPCRPEPRILGNEEPVRGKEPRHREGLFELLVHDLSGPLSIISASTLSLLRQTAANDYVTDREKSTLDRILRNAKRSQGLLQEMIEVLRAEEGLFRKEPFDVGEMLNASILAVLEEHSREPVDELARETNVERFRSMLERYGIFVEISGKYAASSFSHDPRKVKQIVRNLLSNALKHRRRHVRLTISGHSDLLISVADDGPGIPEEHHKSIFGRFVRVGPEDDRSRQGLGLGLAGVKALVEAMGGTIGLLSREERGTEFSVSIPPLAS